MNETVMEPIYLDHAATTPVRPRSARRCSRGWASVLRQPVERAPLGPGGAGALEDARARLAAVIGASAERDRLHARRHRGRQPRGARPRRRARRAGRLLAIEHRAVLMAARRRSGGRPLHLLPVDRTAWSTGCARRRAAERPCLVSVMWANNEVGVVQPIAEIAERCAPRASSSTPTRSRRSASSASGWTRSPVDDALAQRAQDLRAQGVGALFVRRAPPRAADPRRRPRARLRAGTEDVAGAVGLAVAAELAEAEREAEMRAPRRAARPAGGGAARARPGLVVNGAGAERLPTSSERLRARAPARGDAARGARPGGDRRLLGLGLLERRRHPLARAHRDGSAPEIAVPSVRFSLGRETTEGDRARSSPHFRRSWSGCAALAWPPAESSAGRQEKEVSDGAEAYGSGRDVRWRRLLGRRGAARGAGPPRDRRDDEDVLLLRERGPVADVLRARRHHGRAPGRDRLGIPHYVFDVERDFTRDVIDDFVHEYAAGRTPNPCVRCNGNTKFRDLLRRGGCSAATRSRPGTTRASGPSGCRRSPAS
jgi:cysteine desulfurase